MAVKPQDIFLLYNEYTTIVYTTHIFLAATRFSAPSDITCSILVVTRKTVNEKQKQEKFFSNDLK